jgi:hypothetical protein
MPPAFSRARGAAGGDWWRILGAGLSPFDFAQWVLWMYIAHNIFTDPDCPKGVRPLAVIAFS